MKKIVSAFLALMVVMFSTPALADTLATIRVPMCLQFPDNNRYVPCTGVVPVDKTTGNALDWSTIFKGTPTDPVYTKQVSRRQHWTETSQPLIANGTFNSTSRDDGGTTTGGSTQSTAFSCFVITDQTGTLNIQGSDDGVSWITFQSRTITVNTGLYLTQPLFTKYWRCQVVNGAVDQNTMKVYSAFEM